MNMPAVNQLAVIAALLRRDLRYFVWKSFQTILPGTPYRPNWHIDAIVYQLMRIQAGKNRRLLINQPPRSLKSICVSVAYVAWLLGHDPTQRIIVVSYSNEFAAELHRQFRMVVDAPWYQCSLPGMRPVKDTGTELVTTAGGSRYATSVGGTLTGRGADLIIIDDPLKAEDAMSEPAREAGDRLVRRNPGLSPQRQGEWPHHRGDAAPARRRPGRPSARARRLASSRLPAIAVEDSVIPIGRGKVSSRRSVRSCIRSGKARKPSSDQGRDRQPDVLGAVSATADTARGQSHQTRVVPPSTTHLPDQRRDRIVQSWDIAMMTGPGQ